MKKRKKTRYDPNGLMIALLDKMTSRKVVVSNTATNPFKGSLAEKDLIVIEEPTIEPGQLYNGTISNNISIFARLNKNRELGLENEEYKSFLKLVKDVYISHKEDISYEFTRIKCFDWLVVSKIDIEKEGRIKKDFLTYFTDKIEEAKKDFEFSFRMMNLEIEKEFQLEDVKFWYTKKEHFGTKFNDTSKNIINNVFVGCTIKGKELGRAKELAKQKCFYAVDVLKTMYFSFIPPHSPIQFEVDSRCKYQPHSIGLYNEKDSSDSLINWNNEVDNEIINEEIIDWITSADKPELRSTIQFKSDENELYKLVKASITRFSNALSNEKLHGRIVDLVTIWESLLLPNSTSSIKYTLIKYGPKLIYDTIEERRKLAELIKSTYEIRSEYLHHSIESEISESDIIELQKNTLNLILVMYHSSKKYDSKNDLLKEIDIAIEKSFSIMATLRS